MVLVFEPKAFRARVSSHNHYTRAPAHKDFYLQDV